MSLVGTSTMVNQTGRYLIPITRTPFFVLVLLWEDQSKSLRVLIASGTDEGLMDATIALELGIPTQPLSVPMGYSIGEVTHSTVSIQLRVSGNHSETIQFLLIASPHVPVVIEFSWLQKHNPVIDWTTSSILGWSHFCHSHCLQAAQSFLCCLPQDVSKTVDVSAIPTEYHDLLEVYSKARATSLPPYCPYDCAIDLLPGTTPPRSQLYSLSRPETKSMEEYRGASGHWGRPSVCEPTKTWKPP